MVFDIQMILDYFIPDSLGDFGAMLFWVLLILLVSMIVVDIRLFVRYNKSPKIKEKMTQQNQNTEEPLPDIVEVRNKVDKLFKINKM
ncbi:hypothetical protein AYK25_01750 [Thermoplasmatales archaeon SM1-50]|nr:MAG: hypothetical protein AYK25_01750 [Thermoplasmatales archaeon SM1-50]